MPQFLSRLKKPSENCKFFRILFIFALSFLLTESKATGEEPVLTFAKMNLRDLINMKITSVSKRKEKFFDAASAIYVITQEDIRRSGATSIMEALRMAPGLQVGHFSSNVWAISSRGFNQNLSARLLVLIDGRSVYSNVFNGVNWNEQDTMLEDIDRIEVIRGPGATLWGSNAVNGVINIITKNSGKTQKLLASGVAGDEEEGITSIRYGGKLENGINYRVFGKYFNRDTFSDFQKQEAFDDWEVSRGGFRFDWERSENNSFTLQGDYYDGRAGRRSVNEVISLTSPTTVNRNFFTDINGGNILGRWNHKFQDRSEMTVQFYYDREVRQSIDFFNSVVNVFDADIQHQFDWGSKHKIVWGAQSRTIADSIDNTFSLEFTPNGSRFYTNASAFFQDTYSIIPNELEFTFGSKFEVTEFAGFQWEPNMRLAWAPDSKQRVWGAISRAARIPSRLDDSPGGRIRLGVVPLADGTPLEISLFSDPDEQAEISWTYEIGYRVQPTEKILVDIAGFYSQHDDLFSTATGTAFVETSPQPTHIVSPIFSGHGNEAQTIGLETAIKWEVFDYWKLNAAFTYLNIDFSPDSNDTEGNDPKFQFNFRSYLDLSHNFEFDTMVYFVDELTNQDVPRYTRVDLRLGWRPDKNLELSLVGQNLQDDQHPEFREGRNVNITASTETPRSFYGKATWRY